MTTAGPEEEQLQALLREAGRRPQPPEDKRQEWEVLFRRELDIAVTTKRRQRRTSYAATAAVAVLLAGVFLLFSPQLQQPIVVATVATTVDGNQTFYNGDKLPSLVEGSSVHVGQTIRTAGEGMLALSYRRADVRLNRDTTVRFHAARIELIDGSIYVDTGGEGEHGALPVVISTTFGSFSHTGTQFMVTLDDTQGVVAAVREGIIMLLTDDDQKQFNADEDGPRVVRVSRAGSIEDYAADRHGELWAWVLQSSPGKVINGLSADEILNWIAREMGLELRYANPDAKQAAEDAMQVTNDDAVGPQQALEWVDRTAWLTVDTSNGVQLLVSVEN